MKEADLSVIINAMEQMEKITHVHLGDWKHIFKDACTIWQKCNFIVGDKVKLNKTPVINTEESWGWLGSKHFLIKGAMATVRTREFYNGHFVFGLHFDHESWIDGNGKARPVKDTKSLFMFSETWLELVDAKTISCGNYEPLSCEAL
jgi:hypothetical protein